MNQTKLVIQIKELFVSLAKLNKMNTCLNVGVHAWAAVHVSAKTTMIMINMSTKCAVSRSHHYQNFTSTTGRDGGGGTGDKAAQAGDRGLCF